LGVAYKLIGAVLVEDEIPPGYIFFGLIRLRGIRPPDLFAEDKVVAFFRRFHHNSRSQLVHYSHLYQAFITHIYCNTPLEGWIKTGALVTHLLYNMTSHGVALSTDCIKSVYQGHNCAERLSETG